MEAAQAVQSRASAAPAATEEQQHPIFVGVEQLAQRHPGFSVSALRNWIFKSGDRKDSRGHVIPGNGFPVVRLGRKVLIEEGAFLAWVRGHRKAA